jgi:uncharacterized membrane protein
MITIEIWEIHPSLVHFPIALFLSAVVLDLYAWARGQLPSAQVATGLLIAGVLMGLLTGLAGFLAFYTVPSTHTEQAHDLVVWHLGLALAAVVLFAVAAFVRWRAWQIPPAAWTRVVELVAAGLLVAAGYLGGHIVYHGGMGIDPDILSSQLKEDHHHHESSDQHPDQGEHSH